MPQFQNGSSISCHLTVEAFCNLETVLVNIETKIKLKSRWTWEELDSTVNSSTENKYVGANG